MERWIEDEPQPLGGEGCGGGCEGAGRPEPPPWEEDARFEERADEGFPWRAAADAASAEASPQEGPRERHDAFGEARKCAFLEALAKTGCVQDACRRTGVAPRSVYRHQESDPRFAGHIRTALRMSATPIELAAWQRAVEGVDQEFACGGEVHVRRRYDGGLLRLLLMGSNPKKYGPNPGFSRKRLLKAERKQIEREVRAELETAPAKWSFEESLKEVEKSLEIWRLRRSREQAEDAEEEAEARRAEGWTETADGHWIPPGYAPIPGWVAPPSPESGEDTPRESV